MHRYELIDSALTFAARAHDGQKRKNTDVPYIVHPVGVMLALVECGETDPELLAAALLHDTVEDTSVTLAELREKFGERVAMIVEGCSEPDKRDTWEQRKQHTIAFLKIAPRDVQLVSAADKLHNLRSMVVDHAEVGETLWLRFKRGRAEIAWYYRSVMASLAEGQLKNHRLTQELGEAVVDFFGRE
ncbi:MAG TPA: HD domain-containing protein [Anaerolineales bacterium]|nr:HD domain-containing protein [Anaerolineales bacterium]